MTKPDSPALILIDIQKGLDDIEYYGGHRNNPNAEENAKRLLSFWRQNNLPIFHIKHNSTNPNSRLVKGKIGNEIKDIVKPFANEPIIEKEVNSAFIGTDFQQGFALPWPAAVDNATCAGITPHNATNHDRVR